MVTRAGYGFTALSCIVAAVGCEGSGGGGGGLEIEQTPIAANCTPFPALTQFPSGLIALPDGHAAAAQDSPPALLFFDLEAESPQLDRILAIGSDSDLDGLDDTANNPRGIALGPILGELQGAPNALALLSTSNYEQVLVFDTAMPGPQVLEVSTPSEFAPGAFPGLPAPGETEIRTGISTLACVAPAIALDSRGDSVASGCEAGAPSFLTSLTAGKAIAAGRLFVATSNLDTLRDRFLPGTVLVYRWDDSGPVPTVEPDLETPVLFTTAFNPTAVTALTTPAGREFVLVTNTGDIGTGSGAGNVRSDASVDVIDPSVPRIVATIPLGRAAPSYDPIAIDPSQRVGWLGATSERQLYAIDLAALDAPALPDSGPPAVLDGLTNGLPDARIFSAAAPFVLPDRPDGPSSSRCDGFTFATVNASGDALHATDWCDGTLTTLRMDLTPTGAIPLPRTRFTVDRQSDSFSTKSSLGLLRAPTRPRVRSGRPGIDFSGPDVFVLISEPDAQLCALRVESPVPSP